MDFSKSFSRPVSKDFILSKVNQYEIFSYYFGVNIVPKKLYRSKIRNDKKPTVGFYINKGGNLIYHDFGTGEFYDCFNYVMVLYNISYYEALNTIAQDFKIQDHGVINKISQSNNILKEFNNSEKKAVIQCEIKDFTDAELRWWGNFGITPKILNKFRIFSCKTVFLNGNVFAVSAQHCPIYGYYFGKKENIEQWKIYMPNNKDKGIRFLGNCSQKMMQGYHQLPKKGKVCVITKSLKDVAALYAYNIPACAPHSENIIPSESIVNDLLSRFERVFAFWDNDYTGVTFLNKIKKAYPQLKCILIPRKYEVKDFSDLRKKYGHEKTGKLIKEYLENLK